jgi:hypothetical protein
VKGAPNKRTKEALDAARDKSRKALGEDAFDGDAHALLMAVYRNTSLPLEVRLDATKVAINYESPRLNAVAARVDAQVLELSENEETARRLAMAALEKAFGVPPQQIVLSPATTGDIVMPVEMR